ncbi:hypothetical protein PybrP1_013224, partial [[Pythium] brassicae (nom. inval.)]
GPCELWLDDTRVMQDDDCESTFLGRIPTWKIDFSSCKGSCTLRWFWLGLQDGGKRWQVYKNCVPLKGTGSSGGGGGGGGSSSTPISTPKSNSKTPKANSKEK